MKAKEISKVKEPVARLNKSLDKYSGVIVFPEKVAKAKEMIDKMGLPKINELGK